MNDRLSKVKLSEAKTGALGTYMARAVGSDRWGALIGYELVNFFLVNFPGAAGLLLRQKIYPGFIESQGKGAVFSRGVSIRCPRRLSVGDGTLVGEQVLFDIKSAAASVDIGDRGQIMQGACFETGYEGKITLGNDCFVGAYAILNGQGGLTIGNNALIAGHCHIVAGNHGHSDLTRPMSEQDFVSKGIVIEDDVWLGAGAKVLDGVRIGKGSIISAGAVVNRDVAPYSIMGGVPAKLIRMRDGADG